MENSRKKPDWLKIKLPMGDLSRKVQDTIRNNELHTICTSGRCPNQGECWGCGTATFMIGGDICTRSCRFCNVTSGKPLPLDSGEPQRVAESVKSLKIKHVVLTSVDRDDLPDLGAAHWAAVIRAVKKLNPSVTMEALIPDFQGRTELIGQVMAEKPEVISHNMETVRRLTPSIRSKATYDGSLQVISHIARNGITAKSGIMLGLGETREEVLAVMDDLLQAGCRVMTIGQYLRPTLQNVEVQEYVRAETLSE